mmetsp:Transcript_13261/g.24867  ORF Transcript_13261/g.24867 Transcript_13261/m.24867 type:complete len:158 (-) Transcript_13261:1563-2036(-)
MVSAMLYKYDCEQVIDRDDEEVLLELFSKHPNAKEKLEDYDYLTVGQHIGETTTTRCFLISNSNGHRTDISYLKCIDQFARSAKPQHKRSHLSDNYVELLAELAQTCQIEEKLRELVTKACEQLNYNQAPFAMALLRLASKVPAEGLVHFCKLIKGS